MCMCGIKNNDILLIENIMKNIYFFEHNEYEFVKHISENKQKFCEKHMK